VNDKEKVVVAVSLIAVTILSISDARVGTNPITFVMLALIIATWHFLNRSLKRNNIADRTMHVIKRTQDGTIELGEKDRNFMTFHILMMLESRQSIDVSELASEFNVSIYQLNDLIRFLAKHEAIEVIYPPLQNFPILRKGNDEKRMKLLNGIFKALAKRSILGGAKFEDFTKEVEDYLNAIKRH
jgi:hypothetical protein